MIRVTCAIIRNEDEEILIVQRGQNSDHPLKWEFPGGKIMPGESEEECIIREIKEELSMDIVIFKKLQPVKYDYGIKQIELIPFISDTLDELPLLSEHIAFKWIAPEMLSGIDFSEADCIVADQYFPGGSKTSGETVEEIPFNDDLELKQMVNDMMSTKEVEWVATSAVDNPAIFRKLLEFSWSEDKKLAFRSSWTLTKVCDKHPELIYPHLPGIIEAIGTLYNESAERSFLRILSLTGMDIISNKHHGILAEHCFNALRSGFSAIAIKAYSMEILYKLAVIYPELANELAAVITMLQGEGSAGIVARGHLILKKLAEISPGKRGSGEPQRSGG
jgi:8-oxo-dGTP diphosphatase